MQTVEAVVFNIPNDTEIIKLVWERLKEIGTLYSLYWGNPGKYILITFSSIDPYSKKQVVWREVNSIGFGEYKEIELEDLWKIKSV